MESLSLKVEETREYGMGHKYAHIDYPNALNASMGDVLELISIYGWRRRTVAKYWGRDSRYVGKGIIQIDSLVKDNLVVGTGHTVVVRKINAVPAEKVTVTPSEPASWINEEYYYLARTLFTVPVIKGDYVMVPYGPMNKDLTPIPGTLTLQVDSVTPAANVVVITKDTVFESSGRTITENEVRPDELTGQEKIFCDSCGAENMRFWYTLNRSDGTILRRLCVKCNPTGKKWKADGL